jgi:hypothetical protein
MIDDVTPDAYDQVARFCSSITAEVSAVLPWLEAGFAGFRAAVRRAVQPAEA